MSGDLLLSRDIGCTAKCGEEIVSSLDDAHYGMSCRTCPISESTLTETSQLVGTERYPGCRGESFQASALQSHDGTRHTGQPVDLGP